MNTPCGDPAIHDPHSWGDAGSFNWCQGISASDIDESDLLNELAAAERANGHLRSCRACDVLSNVSDAVYPDLKRALAGTIGDEKLSKILASRGYDVGRRAIKRHRQEGHTP